VTTSVRSVVASGRRPFATLVASGSAGSTSNNSAAEGRSVQLDTAERSREAEQAQWTERSE
jgi:hypothetical protein